MASGATGPNAHDQPDSVVLLSTEQFTDYLALIGPGTSAETALRDLDARRLEGVFRSAVAALGAGGVPRTNPTPPPPPHGTAAATPPPHHQRDWLRAQRRLFGLTPHAADDIGWRLRMLAKCDAVRGAMGSTHQPQPASCRLAVAGALLAPGWFRRLVARLGGEDTVHVVVARAVFDGRLADTLGWSAELLVGVRLAMTALWLALDETEDQGEGEEEEGGRGSRGGDAV